MSKNSNKFLSNFLHFLAAKDIRNESGNDLVEVAQLDLASLKSVRKCAEIKQKGSVVVFPSHLWHRVKPVTKGTRYSLVMWNLGYPFK